MPRKPQELFSQETILTGDLNIHHAERLKFSNGNSVQGTDLKILADNLGLQQIVKESTRQQYLLDLFVTDVAGVKMQVDAYIADHKFLRCDVPLPKSKTPPITQRGFRLAAAKWKDLQKELRTVDWKKLREGTAEDAANYFLETLWVLLCTHIPYGEFHIEKVSPMVE